MPSDLCFRSLCSITEMTGTVRSAHAFCVRRAKQLNAAVKLRISLMSFRLLKTALTYIKTCLNPVRL